MRRRTGDSAIQKASRRTRAADGGSHGLKIHQSAGAEAQNRSAQRDLQYRRQCHRLPSNGDRPRLSAANGRGELGVQVKGVKKAHQSQARQAARAAAELYPDDYDFSIVFDTVANRKARRVLDKRHEEGTIVVIKEGEEGI
jgi:adenylate cyclase class IV